MDLGSIFLVLALLIVVIWFISRPFIELKTIPENTLVNQEEHDVSALLAERDQVLDALEELDFDYALGKIPEEDYPAQRKFLLDRGTKILRELDAHQDTGTSAQESTNDVDARLEAAIAARRADVRGDSSAATLETASIQAQSAVMEDADDDLEFMIANRRRNRNDKAAGFCPKCGDPVQKSDLFCPKCGATLVKAEDRT
jgi:hypothetical protein